MTELTSHRFFTQQFVQNTIQFNETSHIFLKIFIIRRARARAGGANTVVQMKSNRYHFLSINSAASVIGDVWHFHSKFESSWCSGLFHVTTMVSSWDHNVK
jgi:hypothetical protein